MKNFVWVFYSKEPPFLPLAIANTAKEIGMIAGATETTVTATWSKYLHGVYPSSRFHKVKITV